MRKYLIFLMVLFFALPIIGQERTGNIYGKAVDDKGEGLPGITVTLSGARTAPMTSLTGARGDFRFVSLSPARDYSLKAELQGFKTTKQDGIIVTVGANVSLTLVMEMGTLQQEVIVTAMTPVVDTKKTDRSFNAGTEILQSLPSARDTLAVFEWVPGVSQYNSFVGTSNMGYQNNAEARAGTGSYWGLYSVDGVRLEWGYGDHDMWEEVQVSMGGVNIKSRSGDLTTNMVTRRGGNNVNFQGRFFVDDEYFQGNHDDAVKKYGIKGIDKIILNKDYGFSIGGPFIKDKAWFWLGYAVQDSRVVNTNLDPVNQVLTSYNAKLNFQLLPQNRIEFWAFSNDKLALGRDAGVTYPGGDKQFSPYHFGAPKGRLGIEHMFGDNLFLSLVGGYGESGYAVQPTNNLGALKMGLRNITSGVDELRASFNSDFRPRYDIYLSGSYFNDSLFGAAHEIKFGVEYETLNPVGAWTRSNVMKYYNYNSPTIDTTGDGVPDIDKNISRLNFWRWAEQDIGRDIYSAYLADTITIGHFNIVAGLRYDSVDIFINDQKVANSVLPDTPAWQDNFTSRTAAVVERSIPRFNIPGFDPNYNWGFFSPRIGLVWDIGGKGKTTAKLSFGRYPLTGDLIDAWKGSNYLPLGANAFFSSWWRDDNKDNKIDYTEFYWHTTKTFAPYRIYDDAGAFVGNWTDGQGTFWSGYDPLNPTQLKNPSVVIPESAQRSDTAMELSATLEHELIPDFMVGLNLTYKLYSNYRWTLPYWPDTGQIDSKNLWVPVGTVPSLVGGQSTGDGAGQTYYLRSAAYTQTQWSIEQMRPDYNHKYYGVDLVFEKRFSGKWYLGGSFTLQTDRIDFGANGYTDPNQLFGYQGANRNTNFPRWIGKLHGMYALPWDLNVSFMLNARDSWSVNKTLQIRDLNAPNIYGRDATVFLAKYGSYRLDPFISLAIKLEKMIKVTERGKFYFSVDVFNVLNMSTVTGRFEDRIGQWFPHDNTVVPYAQRNLVNRIMNPIEARLGARFQF